MAHHTSNAAVTAIYALMIWKPGLWEGRRDIKCRHESVARTATQCPARNPDPRRRGDEKVRARRGAAPLGHVASSHPGVDLVTLMVIVSVAAFFIHETAWGRGSISAGDLHACDLPLAVWYAHQHNVSCTACDDLYFHWRASHRGPLHLVPVALHAVVFRPYANQ